MQPVPQLDHKVWLEPSGPQESQREACEGSRNTSCSCCLKFSTGTWQEQPQDTPVLRAGTATVVSGSLLSAPIPWGSCCGEWLCRVQTLPGSLDSDIARVGWEGHLPWVLTWVVQKPTTAATAMQSCQQFSISQKSLLPRHIIMHPLAGAVGGSLPPPHVPAPPPPPQFASLASGLQLWGAASQGAVFSQRQWQQ